MYSITKALGFGITNTSYNLGGFRRSWYPHVILDQYL